jgi:hypothetical protein
MSATETKQPDPEPGGTVWDAPNQQVVREDGSPPWEEGTGGDAGEAQAEASEPSLDQMTKAQLLEYAEEHGVVADDSMTKDEIRAAIGN